MTTIATDVQWTSNAPTIKLDFAYEKQRSGTDMQYKVKITVSATTGARYFGYPIYSKIYLDNTLKDSHTIKEASPDQWSSALTYTTGWLTLSNKTTGTTSLKINVYSGLGSDRDAVYTYSVPIDPAKSTVTATDANIGSTSTININRGNSSFTHTLKYKAAGQSSYTTIVTKTPDASYGWTIPTSLYSLIGSARTLSITISCETFSGNTSLGSNTCTLTATAAESTNKPTVSVSAYDSNTSTMALTGNNKKIVKGFSNIAVTTTATAKNGASISSIRVTCGTKSGSGASCTITAADSATVTAYATDSRNYSNYATAPGLTLIDYIPLTINATAERVSPTSSTVNISANGNYFNGSFGSTANTLQVKMRYREKGTSSWSSYISLTCTISGNSYTASGQLTNLSYTKAYDIRVYAYDKIYDGLYSTVNLSRGLPVFDWGESDFAFHVPVTASAGGNIDTLNCINNIQSGDDLNDYDTPGNYYSDGAAVSRSLYNCPITNSGFGLVVREIQSSIYVKQEIYCAKWQFTRYTNGTSWSNWRKTLCTEDTSQDVCVDYVVEQGSSGIWTYRKWNSGRAECWGSYSYTTDFTNAWGSLYVATSAARQNYPFTFSSRPKEIATHHSSSSACWMYTESYSGGARGINTTTQTAMYGFARPTSITSNSTITIDYYVVGEV